MEKKATVFEFASYTFEPEKKRIVFAYKQEFKNTEPISYAETIILPDIAIKEGLPAGLVDKILQNLHLILGISYYKFYCAPKIKLDYKLSKEEAEFWNIVYKKGLGEFFYRNKLDPKISPKFPHTLIRANKGYGLDRSNRTLVCIGGGKDSLVALELLKKNGNDISAVFTETGKESGLINNLLQQTGVDYLKASRQLDWQVFQTHKYNGHIPVSAIYAFLGLLYSVLYGYGYCVVANEFSSNFGSIKYKGLEINHQWSKSLEFETLFQDYVKKFITPDIKYFSLLRPFYEIRIAEIFSEYKKYFPYFSSCNKNFTANGNGGGLWCGGCPKCVFAFVLFSAFLQKDEVLNIFKKSLYQEEKLLPLFKDILGAGKLKPFDCVGTFEEARVSFLLGAEKFKNDFIVRQLLGKIKATEKTEKEVFSAKQTFNIPSPFKFLGMKSVLILGHGKEGQVSEKYIRQNYPELKLGIGDAKLDKNYLKKQGEFDIAVKTPGIKKDLLKIPYTTATNIFFSKISGKNKIIGITGSKGKSTTTSLVYHILKAAGKSARLLGNIGYPMLEALMEPIDKDEIFVLELSSQQLEDLDISPDISVVTNLFPEHMDYHGNEIKYYEAKKNIINFQNKNGIFVYNKKNKMLSKWAESAAGKTVGFDGSVGFDFKSPLLGEHNKENISAAIAVAKIFNISDEEIKKAIESFKPLPHRLEFVGEFGGIKFYDDAISTTPESTIMAIKTLKDIDTIFLGGEDRGYKFSELEKIIKKYKIKNIVLFPDSGKRILKSKKGFNVLETKNMKQAVDFAFKYTAKGKICLLSCASPSYSLWKNFEEKGDLFKKFVNEKAF